MSERHKRLERIFDRWAASYGRSPKEEGLFVGYRRSLEGAAALARVSAGMRVLDVGIGTGALAGSLVGRRRGVSFGVVRNRSGMGGRCRRGGVPSFGLVALGRDRKQARCRRPA